MDCFNIHTHTILHPEREIVSYDVSAFSPGEGYASVGIHPWMLTEENANAQWEVLQELVQDKRIIAIGEVGLDKLKGPSLELQTNLFRKEILLSEAKGMPLVIHCVKAFNELIQLRKEIRPQQPWIVHGFRGKLPLAEDLLKHGCFLSFGAKFQVEAVKTTPIDRLFVETDDSDIPIEDIYQNIANVRGMTSGELIEAVNKNVQKVFLKA